MTFVFIFTLISDKIQKLPNSCSADIPTPSEYYQRCSQDFQRLLNVAQNWAPSCQDHAYLGEITKTRYCETLTYDLGLNETFCTVHRTFLHGNWIQFLMLIVTEQVVRNYGLCMWSSPVCMWLTFSICRHLRHG